MKTSTVVGELFLANGWTDRQTDRQIDLMKLIVAFRNFSKEPKNERCCILNMYLRVYGF
jgi:hypothetical protein